MSSLSDSAQMQRTNVIKIGSIAAGLFAASLVASAIASSAVTSVSRVVDDATAATFLDDLAQHRDWVVFYIWMIAAGAVLLVPFAAGMYEGLRDWNETLMKVARLSFILAAVMVAVAAALEAPIAGYIVPAWSATGDAVIQAQLASTTTALGWATDALFSMVNLTVGIGVGVSSIVMIRTNRRWWQILGWLGLIGGIVLALATFTLLTTTDAYDVANGISGAIVFVWLLGTCVGLWQLTMATSVSAVPVTGDAAVHPGGSAS